ncbi:MAG: response regulator transcription factor [Bacteroidota bacterium]|nr:response regulator transcription factor [Bacteroidota bacterium]
MKQKIFLVEDDMNFGLVLKSYLEINDYEVTHVADGKDAIPTFKKDKFDLVVCDVMLPNVDGFTIGKEIREIEQGIPLIFLTAKSLKEDVLKGFNVGADDYVTKPFDSDVLMMKIKAILKRSERFKDGSVQDIVKIGTLEYHTKLRQLKFEDESQKLSPREGELLKLLYINRNNVMDRNEALRSIWGDDNYFNARSMDVYITKLRKYLKKDPRLQINNVHSSGFILVTPD